MDFELKSEYGDLVKFSILEKTIRGKFPNLLLTEINPMSYYDYGFIFKDAGGQLSLTYSFIDIRDNFNKCVEKTVELISSRIYKKPIRCKFHWEITNPGSFTENATAEFYLEET